MWQNVHRLQKQAGERSRRITWRHYTAGPDVKDHLSWRRAPLAPCDDASSVRASRQFRRDATAQEGA